LAGIVRYGSYVPYYRLQRAALGEGKGERAIASYDEDAVSMAVEAAREALSSGGQAPEIDSLLLASTSLPYAEKLNAALVHAACNLPSQVCALDLAGSTRAGVTGLLAGADLASAGRHTLVCTSDVVVGAPGGGREREGGDAAVAFVMGDGDGVLARIVGRASLTDEFLDVWRTPEMPFAKQWEERFGREVLVPLLREAITRALQSAELQPADLATLICDATNPRAAVATARSLGLKPEQVADSLAASVGRAGAAHACLLLARALDHARPGDRIALVSGADGADAVILEVSEAITQGRPERGVDRWIEAKRNDVPYNSYLKWRGVLPFEPPRRPDPQRPAAPPMRRAERWKFGFVGTRCSKCQTANLPPQRVCVACGAVDQMRQEPYADAVGRIATYAIDHLAYSLQPPSVNAVIDFEKGGRFTCEVTDVDPNKVAVGDQLEMSFRRLFTADGVHNYFWKARSKR
jgi:3-hydroxy-3-methylglutaryl CoA synthase